MLVAKLANLYYRVLSPCRSQLTLMARQNSKCYNKCPQVCRGSSLTLLSCRKSKFLEKNFHKQSQGKSFWNNFSSKYLYLIFTQNMNIIPLFLISIFRKIWYFLVSNYLRFQKFNYNFGVFQQFNLTSLARNLLLGLCYLISKKALG